jgi:hypothetical protein
MLNAAGSGVDPACVTYGCAGFGKAAYQPKAGAECGHISCPAGTVGSGCTQYCQANGKCEACIPNCVLGSADEIILACPKSNALQNATVTATLFVGGSTTCIQKPNVSVSGPDGLLAYPPEAGCSNGIHAYAFNTSLSGRYSIKAQAKTETATLSGECSFDNLQSSQPGGLSATSIIAILVMGLPLGFVAVIFFMRATQ